MNERLEKILKPVFRGIIAKRWWVIGIYAALLAAAIPFALRVEQDNGIDRLIIKSDPDFLANQAFSRVFGAGEYVVLFAEAEDPFSPEVIRAMVALDEKLRSLPGITSNSLMTIYRQSRPGADPAADPDGFRKFATDTDLFTKQGLIGKGFYGLPLILDVKSSADRTEAIRKIDGAVDYLLKNPAPLKSLRRVGEPYVNVHLNAETAQAGMRMFPVFALFVILLVVWLYRSFRTLSAFIISLAVNVALTVGYIGLTGGNFTIVSSLIPMTIMVTCLANLVYIHSRFIERPPESGVDDHQIFALSNKFLACTTSVTAAAVGFAALYVSDIRPIRELGAWIAVGMVFTWLVSFTLFPALQKILKTPTQIERKTTAQWFTRVVDVMPELSYRHRWKTVASAVALCVLGSVALFGLPGYIKPMKMLTSPVDYINSGTELYKDTRRVEQIMPGLSMADVWLKGRTGTMNQPEVVKGLDDFQNALEKEPMIGSAVGPTSVLRMIRYIGGKGDRIPEDPDELESLTDSLEAFLNEQPLLKRFVEPKNMAQTHITLVTRLEEFPQFQELGVRVCSVWRAALGRHPALGEFGNECPLIVGIGRLQAKVAHNLVPTLTESFALTVAILFLAFLVVFRNGAARLMAMLPSLFAILVMFAIMRLTGMSLNVATILIASTILGASENDQIHFFYHFLEGQKKGGTTESGLRHTAFIAGRSIFFATAINSIGFLAFALNDLPPIRQFGLLTSVAFALAMIADFTALPGALWMVFRDKPESMKKS